jgi:putative sigma-54 modulation protein
MQIEINSRHFQLGDEQREKIEERLQKLERFSPRPPISARLTLTQEAGRFAADLAFFLKNSDFRAKAEGMEPELAADEAIESIRTQLQKHKGKITGRAKAETGGLGRAMLAEDEGLLDTEGATLQTEGFVLKDLSVEDALEIFRNSQHPFFVFRNRETAKVSVVYRRDDGDFGLLEPVDE